MKITKNDLLKAHDIAYKVLSFVDSNSEIRTDKILILDTSLEIFNPDDYPFDLSFDDLLSNLDEIFEEKDMDEIFKELGEDFIIKYLDYIKNTLYPRYRRLLMQISKKLYFIKFRVFDKIENLLNISEYAIDRVTEKRVYYYQHLDSDSTSEDISFISIDALDNYNLQLKGNIMITAWCLESEKEDTIKNLKQAVYDYLNRQINSLDSYAIVEKSNINFNK